MNATRWCAATLLALVAVRVAWAIAWQAPALPAAAGILWPLLPFVAALAFGLRGVWIYAGIGAGIYFCHGVMEAWATPDARGWALGEALLAVGYFLAYWRRALGLRAAARAT